MNDIFLSIVVPVYNEGYRIADTLKKIDHFFGQKNFNSEIIVVDDGSVDDTFDKSIATIESLKIKCRLLRGEKNRGKGFALKQGFAAADGTYIFFTDADLSTPLIEFDKFLHYLQEGNQVVIGSRHLPESEITIHQSELREFFGKIFYKLVSSFFIKGVTDTNCGFKIYKKEEGKKLFSHLCIYRWGFDAEIIYLAQKYGFKIKEVPVSWADKPNSKVNIIFAICNTLVELGEIKINDWRGKYLN